jgi:hypothetical protein
MDAKERRVDWTATVVGEASSQHGLRAAGAENGQARASIASSRLSNDYGLKHCPPTTTTAADSLSFLVLVGLISRGPRRLTGRLTKAEWGEGGPLQARFKSRRRR